MTESDLMHVVGKFHEKMDEMSKTLDGKFNRVYDTLASSQRDLSLEISGVTECFHGHKKDCLVEFKVLRDNQGQHGRDIITIKERHAQEDKKRWDVKKLLFAGALSGVVGWIIYKLTAMDAMLSKITG
ncbi:MAG: hypothetical protein Q8P24_10985 [Desulfobacterales bacterium]|nr:hypothetical protein [Desulfobacterales bacterium]